MCFTDTWYGMENHGESLRAERLLIKIDGFKKMAIATDSIVFGSFVKGIAKEWSDIDVALVSPDFTGDRFEDRIRIIPMIRKIDSRIEPIPFRSEDFDNGGMLVEEIKRTGTRIQKK